MQGAQLVKTADQHAFDKIHGECGPAGPQLERVAHAPLAQVAAVFQVVVFDTGRIEQLAGLANEGVGLHADHDYTMVCDGRLHFQNHRLLVVCDFVADGGVDMGFVKNMAGHRMASKK